MNSTSELDTLNFGSFMKNLHGGAPRVIDNYSATSSWNVTEVVSGSGDFITRNIRLIFLIGIVYLIYLARKQEKIQTKSKPTKKSPAPSPAPSTSPTSEQKPSTSVSSTASSAPSVSVSVKKYEGFGEYF
jgi:hypothetical protein